MTHKYKHLQRLVGACTQRAYTQRLGVSRAPCGAGECSHSKLRSQERASAPEGLLRGSPWQIVCILSCVCSHGVTPGLALGPEPSLAREDPQSLCPPSHSSGLAQLALPTGALGGSALRPTRTLTQDNHGGRGWVEVWTGHHKPEQQLPTEGALGDRPAQGRKGSFLVAWEGTECCRESQSPPAPGLVGHRGRRLCYLGGPVSRGQRAYVRNSEWAAGKNGR